MNTSKVEICGVNTALLPVLNEEQKTQLLLAAKAGNSEARAQMIQGNLRLVLSVVQKFAGRGENLDDLFQVGCIGLIKAIDNFDPGLKVRFSTYGVPMILGEIRRFLRDNTPIRVSRSVRDLAYHAMQAREALQKETGREPRVSEIAARIMFKDTVQALTPRERRIIALRYLSGQTQMQVAQAIGISQAQVSRLEKCALNHIKEQISCR